MKKEDSTLRTQRAPRKQSEKERFNTKDTKKHQGSKVKKKDSTQRTQRAPRKPNEKERLNTKDTKKHQGKKRLKSVPEEDALTSPGSPSHREVPPYGEDVLDRSAKKLLRKRMSMKE
jgi:hypothetical protein